MAMKQDPIVPSATSHMPTSFGLSLLICFFLFIKSLVSKLPILGRVAISFAFQFRVFGRRWHKLCEKSALGMGHRWGSYCCKWGFRFTPGAVSGFTDELILTVTNLPILEDSMFGDFNSEAFEKEMTLNDDCENTFNSNYWCHNFVTWRKFLFRSLQSLLWRFFQLKINKEQYPSQAMMQIYRDFNRILHKFHALRIREPGILNKKCNAHKKF
jgi:hypothetical protein